MLVVLTISGSVRLSTSCSRLFLTTPSFSGDHHSLEGLGHVPSPLLAWPALSASGPPHCVSPTTLKVKLSHGLASELLFTRTPPHPYSCSNPPHPQEQGGTPEVKGGPGCHPSVGGSAQDCPRQLGSSCQQEPNPAGLAPS